MTVVSKLFRKTCRNWSCYELGHTWSPYCSYAWTEVGFKAFREGFKIYLPLYIVAAILRGKGYRYYLKHLIPEALRSATFLGTNGFVFLCAFCVWRWILGGDYFIMMFLSAAMGGIAAIFLERKFRRSLLAVYMANIACETLYLMLKARGIVHPLPYGEVWLFSGAAATLMYLFRSNQLQGSTLSAIRHLAEGPRPSNTEKAALPSNADPQSIGDQAQTVAGRQALVRKFFLCSRIAKQLQQFHTMLRQLGRNKICQHGNGCIYHMLEGGVRFFSYGYMIQVVLRLFRLIRLLPRQPGRFFKSLFLHSGSINFGNFLGSLVLLLRGVRCGLCYFLQKDSTWQSALAGFVSGWSMLFFRSSSIAMYVASKTVELVYMRGIDIGVLPSIKYGDIILYSIAVAFVFHACIFEPHNVRPAYYTFLKRICGGRFQQMNRRLLDEFGTQASKLDPNFWPKYDARFTSLAAGPHMIAELTRQARLGIS